MENVTETSDPYDWFPNLPEIKAQLNDRAMDLMFDPPYTEVSRITDNIYITSIGGITKANFELHQFQCILDFCHKHHYIPNGITYHKMVIVDHFEQSICDLFNPVVDMLYENDSNGSKTLVHCYGGASRSASMVIAYFMKYHSLSLHDAFNYVRARRYATCPNPGFFRQLIDYEFKLFGKCSVKIIKVRNEAKKLATELPDFFVREHNDLVELAFWFIERDLLPGTFPTLPYD